MSVINVFHPTAKVRMWMKTSVVAISLLLSLLLLLWLLALLETIRTSYFFHQHHQKSYRYLFFSIPASSSQNLIFDETLLETWLSVVSQVKVQLTKRGTSILKSLDA